MKKLIKIGNEIWICGSCNHAYDYDDESFECECGRVVCEYCRAACAWCERSACKKCLMFDEAEGEFFCDIGSNGKLEDSECWQEWIKGKENENHKQT